jgi:hypothetical protein
MADAEGGSCRLCRVYCDWVIDLAGCQDTACVNLYGYDDAEGRRVIGCLAGVFRAELDREAVDGVRAQQGGRFGGLRAVRRPLPVCRAAVERAYPSRVEAVGCLNPEFAEPHVGPAFRVTMR